MLKCGIYEHDITPALGAQIPGYFTVRLASGIKERLYAEAVVFAEDDKVVSVIVACDMIGIPATVCDRARAEIAEKLGLDEAAVTIHATHVHTGGPTLNFVCTRDDAFCDWLGDKAVEAAVLASQRMVPVRIGFGRAYDETIANYRDRVLPDGSLRTNAGVGTSKPFGKIDPEVSCLIIDHADGGRMGVIVNYACHTDCVGGTEFSSDFPGAMRDTLRLVYGAEFMPVFLNGFFGNLNHIDFENGTHAKIPKYYRAMGRKLAGRVISAMEDRDVVWFDEPKIAGVQRRFKVRHRGPSEEELTWARDAITHLDDFPINDRHFANTILATEELGDREMELCVQVQKIGGVNLFACPREMFVEFGFMLKEGSDSDMNITTCNANGDCGYVQIRELLKPGIYESRLDSGKLEPDAGYKMVDAMLEIMKEI
ncbi:MAG: hypothetical protein IKM07_01865 [Clostridia bacterium]|nr:hypothetical protein [Clostridia bacterium]